MDLKMPEMDGIAFCHALKTEVLTSHIPVILLTANSADPVLISGLENGADDYITKPFNPEELRLRVRNLLQSRKQFREKFAGHVCRRRLSEARTGQRGKTHRQPRFRRRTIRPRTRGQSGSALCQAQGADGTDPQHFRQNHPAQTVRTAPVAR